MNPPSLSERITGKPLTRANLRWIEDHIGTAAAPFARFLALLLLLHAYRVNETANSKRPEK